MGDNAHLGFVRTKTTKILGLCAHGFVRTRDLGKMGKIFSATGKHTRVGIHGQKKCVFGLQKRLT